MNDIQREVELERAKIQKMLIQLREASKAINDIKQRERIIRSAATPHLGTAISCN